MKHLSEDMSVLATAAMGKYKALMCTLDPFPSAKTEADLADQAWKEILEEKGLENIEPTKDIRNSVRAYQLFM